MRRLHGSFAVLAYVAAGAMLVALVAPREALANKNYSGNVVGECVVQGDVTYNVKATTNWGVNELQYTFTPTPAKSISVDPDVHTRYFAIPPGTYSVRVGDSEIQGNYSITVPDCGPPRKGLTWRLISTNSPTGTIRVGCGTNECEPHHGDTECTETLPLLCIMKAGAGFPLPLPVSVQNNDRYNRWSGGIVGTTSAIVPPTTLSAANTLCVQQFGAHWRVAEWHDGWGWYFQAYGGVGNASSRFWVHINDQPGATCWH
jgi:hypothetical protein